jgi:hypothetical protein
MLLCCCVSGYGRLALVRLLLERGAALEALNGKQQQPADVAALNGEVRRIPGGGGRGGGVCMLALEARA